MNFSVTKNGKALDKSLYNWDEDTRTFFTNESGLVLDFSGIDDCTFNTGYDCTFNTGSYCTFNTGNYCTFYTGHNCTFKTGDKCCLHYTKNNCFEVYKLPPNKEVKILENGQLEDVKSITKKIELDLTEEQIQSLMKQGFEIKG